MVKLEMNERIRELAFKAAGGMLSYDGEDEWWLSQKEAEKFAELIVRECARVIDRGDGEMSSMNETIWCNVCRDDILKHFGIEP